MDEIGNQTLQSFAAATPAGSAAPAGGRADNAMEPIGVVLEIAGSGSQIALDSQRLNECIEDEDPSVALAGQVGSQVKIRVGNSWLLASVRNQKQDRRPAAGSSPTSISSARAVRKSSPGGFTASVAASPATRSRAR